MMENAMANEIVWEVVSEIGPGRPAISGSMSVASAGSPIQPSPRLAMVMPSCVAAMNWSGFSSARLTGRAMRLVTMTDAVRSALLSGNWDATALLLDRYEEVEATAARLPYISGWDRAAV